MDKNQSLTDFWGGAWIGLNNNCLGGLGARLASLPKEIFELRLSEITSSAYSCHL